MSDGRSHLPRLPTPISSHRPPSPTNPPGWQEARSANSPANRAGAACLPAIPGPPCMFSVVLLADPNSPRQATPRRCRGDRQPYDSIGTAGPTAALTGHRVSQPDWVKHFVQTVSLAHSRPLSPALARARPRHIDRQVQPYLQNEHWTDSLQRQTASTRTRQDSMGATVNHLAPIMIAKLHRWGFHQDPAAWSLSMASSAALAERPLSCYPRSVTVSGSWLNFHMFMSWNETGPSTKTPPAIVLVCVNPNVQRKRMWQ